MAKIGKYFGTAYEFKGFLNIDEIGTAGTFSYNYAPAIFGGNSKGGQKLFYNTLFVKNNVDDLGIKNYTNWLIKRNTYGIKDSKKHPEYKRRNHCLRGRFCGRGIGVFKFDSLYKYKTITIKKYMKEELKELQVS